MTASDTYSFEVELLKGDYAAFGRYFAIRRARIYLRTWILTALAGALVLGLLSRDVTFAFVAALAWFVSMTALSYFSTRRAPGRMAAMTASAAGPFRLTISAEGTSTMSATTTVHRTWLAVSEVVERNGLLILFLSPVSAQLVPRRLVADEVQWESLVRNVRAWWESTRAAARSLP